ncbi:SET and mynd domain containing, putative [Babesia caballi]|uniref:SET and mynd domain containing, putative n=1 Tax=Babesia caballi TaxID=5871 RepID=A0AAV4LPM0_BABCB|nr:SET and mynd domain containing, putative [Babesia caballi]
MIATLDNYYGAPWHTIPPKGDKGAHDEVDRLASASDAFELLMLALNRFMRSLKAQYACHVDRLSTLNYYLELLVCSGRGAFTRLQGKVELVAVEIEIENPVNEQLHALMEDATVRSIIGKVCLPPF